MMSTPKLPHSTSADRSTKATTCIYSRLQVPPRIGFSFPTHPQPYISLHQCIRIQAS